MGNEVQEMGSEGQGRGMKGEGEKLGGRNVYHTAPVNPEVIMYSELCSKHSFC